MSNTAPANGGSRGGLDGHALAVAGPLNRAGLVRTSRSLTYSPMQYDMSFEPIRPRGLQREELRREHESERSMLGDFFILVDSMALELREAVQRLAALVRQLPQPISILSFMRGGVPVGFVLAEICRGRGMDIRVGLLGWVRGENAAIAAWGSHAESASTLLLDGWTGSGSTMREVLRRWHGAPVISAALADPARVCDIAGTQSDLICPHALLQPSASLGFSRVVRDSHGLLVAVRSDFEVRIFRGYCQDLLTSTGRTHQSTSEPRPRTALPSQMIRRPHERSRFRLGINECWRALARGELAWLVVDPTLRDSPDVRLLVEAFEGGIRWGMTGSYKCWGAVW